MTVLTHRPTGARYAGTRTAVEVLTGELDIAAVPKLREQLSAHIGTGLDRLVLDVSAVTFLDSSGLATLIAARRRLSAAGTEVALRGVTRRVRRVLAVSGLHHVFPVEAPA